MPLLAPNSQGVVQSPPHGTPTTNRLSVMCKLTESPLQWMLIASNIGMLIWGGGWSCEWIFSQMP
jgi:hypothetical protein